jgi:hypothetical protein
MFVLKTNDKTVHDLTSHVIKQVHIVIALMT